MEEEEVLEEEEEVALASLLERFIFPFSFVPEKRLRSVSDMIRGGRKDEREKVREEGVETRISYENMRASH